jgi:hypothetical protein
MGFLLRGLILFLLVGLIAISIILGWSILFGWVLKQVVSFSLFESTLLVLIASALVIQIVSRLVQPSNITDDQFADAFENIIEPHIPPTRFYKTDTDKTWEAWFNFVVSNSIYDELEDEESSRSMNKQQLQELAIRLSEVGTAMFKAQSGRSRHASISPTALKQQMRKMNLKPYDDDILDLAAIGINIALALPTVELVHRAKLWDKPTSLFDLEEE